MIDQRLLFSCFLLLATVAGADSVRAQDAPSEGDAKGEKEGDAWGAPVEEDPSNEAKETDDKEVPVATAPVATGPDAESTPPAATPPKKDPPAARAPNAPVGRWKNPFVSERAPNRFGQTGLRQITSASPGRSGDVGVGLQLRGFYSPDFLVPGVADTTFFGGGSANVGFSLFDLVELSLATRFAGIENDGVKPSAAYALGDIAASAKVGYGIGPVILGADVRLILPPAPQGILPDPQNVSARGLGLVTLDLYDAYGIPFRAHLNAGYTFQADRFAPDGPRDLYYANDPQTHLAAIAKEQWFYDSVSAGLGLEVPLPFVTPYLEVWGRTAVLVLPDRGVGGGAYNYLSDPHVTLSPGVRITPAPGLNIDVGADVGVLGTGGYLQPDVANAVNGQPLNPLWTANVGVSYTFQPFYEPSASSRSGRSGGSNAVNGGGSTSTNHNNGQSNGASSGSGSTDGAVPVGDGVAQGCVVDNSTDAPVEDAIVEFVGSNLPRLATKANGCFRLGQVPTEGLTVEVRHPDFELGKAEVATESGASESKIALVALPRKGIFKGFTTNEKDKDVTATIELTQDGGEATTVKTKGGTFSIELDPGSYQAVVKAKGYLQQGAKVVVEKNGRTIRNFVLKLIPKKRISEIKKGKIAIRTRIPFAYSQARLLRAAEFILDDVVDVILSNAKIKKIRIEGHTDNTGDADYNKKLSEERALAVRDYLIDKGVPADRLDAKGYGSKKPIARNDRESGRAKNRRVDFVIVDDNSTAKSP